MATVNTDVNNSQTATLSDSAAVSAPLVALAYSFAVLTITGASANAGKKYTVTCNNRSVTISLDAAGKASLSLLPYIRNAVLSSGALDDPLYCPKNATTIQNKYRGTLSVSVTPSGGTATALTIYYIFGNYPQKAQTVRDIYLDYDASGETWALLDQLSLYDANGAPNDFDYNWADFNKVVSGTPTADFTLQKDVAWFYGASVIKFRTVTYHFRYDCRVGNIMKLRWLDQNGNINCRKFTFAGRSHGGATENSWYRPHTYKALVHGTDPYNRGIDEWATIAANETISLGDDAIPIEHFDWLKSLTSSAIIEAYKNSEWVRCNITSASVECDPRKRTFSMSLVLVFPTDDVQQF